MPEPTRIKIEGRVASKKNSRRIFTTNRGKLMNLPSSAYAEFAELAGWQLKSCRARFTGKIKISYIFELKGKQRIDADNAMASINDCLQDAGIIDDDNNIVQGSFMKVEGCKDHCTYLIIENIICK